MAHQDHDLLPPAERVQLTIDRLPSLTKDAVADDDWCAICLTPFADIFNLQVDNEHSKEDKEHVGVTSLPCGHIFCRKE
jgi:hypothetical protein